MEAQKTTWIASLEAALESAMVHTCGMRQSAYKRLLAQADTLALLQKQPFTKRALCAETLLACAPAMERLCPAPQEGWLCAAFESLSYRLYPAPGRPQETPPLSTALCFYLTALAFTIEWEACCRAYDPLTDVTLLTPEEYGVSPLAAEYEAFVQLVKAANYIPLMRLARECKPFDPLAHTAGVHHVAVHTARQMRACGVPADVALVSAAALSHDVGKFGCRNGDAGRIPYLHYYFTDLWLRQNGLDRIAHIAANHSTWDLEYENLPAESLVLIYADFRVRGERDASGEHIKIHSLQSAGDIVFHKLANVDDKKRRRYELVYRKLTDFESFLTSRGVNPDALSDALLPVMRVNPALMTDAQGIDAIKHMAVRHNLLLMESVSTSASFERLLERARSEKNLESIRTYLNLFDEYFTYMTRSHKLQTLNFLYELLMHHERDVRRQAGKLMGRILANSGLQYQKELPAHAPETANAPTLSEMLSEGVTLWGSFLALIIAPDPKIEKRHGLRIQNSLKVVVASLLTSCQNGDAQRYLAPLIARFTTPGADRFALCDAIPHIPAELFTPDMLPMLTRFLLPLITSDGQREQVCALRALEHLCKSLPSDAHNDVAAVLSAGTFPANSASRYLSDKLGVLLGGKAPESPGIRAPELYLDNLKTTVHWIVKVVNIDRLADCAQACPLEAFHVATHFGNLLLISEHLPVREHAGRKLVEVAALLSPEEVNEIVIDLCRGLGSGQAEFSRYVPPCLAALACRLPIGQLDETIHMLEALVCSDNPPAACSALYAFGALLTRLIAADTPEDAQKLIQRSRITGALMRGLAHFDDAVHRAALTVFCRDVFGSDSLALSARRKLFMEVAKKLLTVIFERAGNDITFFNTAAMLNHLYRMMVACEVDIGPFAFDAPGLAAFFPGTFDPFSDGHKRIVTEIRARGFEVYLAIDEFSWSKRTQPKLLRRQIALMSVADCAGVYLFPDDVPINIANPADLDRLKSLFINRTVYLVAGSDVIEHASAYRDPALLNGACTMNHILFERSRGEEDENRPAASDRLCGDVIKLTLPTYYEDVSSSRIREFIDKNLEISAMVDPVAEAFIHRRGLYLRAPQYKYTLRPEDRAYTIVSAPDPSTFHALRALPAAFCDGLMQALRTGHGLSVLLMGDDGAACGAAYGRTVNTAGLMAALGSMERAEYVRQHASGRMLLIEGAMAGPDGDVPELINELLTASLGSDHTYALCRRSEGDEMLLAALLEKGFVPAGGNDVLMVDMRSPVAMTCDAFMMLKEPFASDPEVVSCVLHARERLLSMICGVFPGELVLAFDTARINRALIGKVQQYNGVLGLPEKPRRLGPFMCVPYGKILSDVAVPNTVTKTLHVEKVFAPDIRHFSIEEAADYSPLISQLAVIHSFDRSVLLVDDLLHNGYRMQKLDPLFTQAGIDVKKILVGILSGRGKDLMDTQGRDVDAVYWIPNLKYWFTESLLYPFIGGDSLAQLDAPRTGALPSVNLILPYKSPDYLRGVPAEKKRALSVTALGNAYEILHTLEQRHKSLYRRSLTLSRLGEALQQPRLPDRGRVGVYDGSLPASAYVKDDLERMQRFTEEIG